MKHEMDEIKELSFLVISLTVLYSTMAMLTGHQTRGSIQILETLINALIISLVLGTAYSVIKNKYLADPGSENSYIPFSPARIKAMKNSEN